MKYLNVFKMPNAVSIMARTSSITNAFFNGIIPCIKPTELEVKMVLDTLGMTPETIRCAYCGEKMTEWDHFRPLVVDKLPTGYITEINNLVPACGKCNQSKGNSYWKDWITGSAKLSPKSRNIDKLDDIILKLETFETKTKPVKLDIISVVGEDLWREYLYNLENMHKQMKECQDVSNIIKKKIYTSLNIGDKGFLKEADVKDESCNSDKKIGRIVQEDFVKILTKSNISEHLVNGLQNLEFCKKFLKVNFPVLKEVSNGDIVLQRKDHLGYNRYYMNPIYIRGKQFLLTSQWKEKSRQSLFDFMSMVEFI